MIEKDIQDAKEFCDAVCFLDKNVGKYMEHNPDYKKAYYCLRDFVWFNQIANVKSFRSWEQLLKNHYSELAAKDEYEEQLSRFLGVLRRNEDKWEEFSQYVVVNFETELPQKSQYFAELSALNSGMNYIDQGSEIDINLVDTAVLERIKQQKKWEEQETLLRKQKEAADAARINLNVRDQEIQQQERSLREKEEQLRAQVRENQEEAKRIREEREKNEQLVNEQFKQLEESLKKQISQNAADESLQQKLEQTRKERANIEVERTREIERQREQQHLQREIERLRNQQQQRPTQQSSYKPMYLWIGCGVAVVIIAITIFIYSGGLPSSSNRQDSAIEQAGTNPTVVGQIPGNYSFRENLAGTSVNGIRTACIKKDIGAEYQILVVTKYGPEVYNFTLLSSGQLESLQLGSGEIKYNSSLDKMIIKFTKGDRVCEFTK